MKTHVRFLRQGLEVSEISDREWRVSDTRSAAEGAPPLVGFILQLDGMFEVTQIGRPGRRTYFRSFDAALGELHS
ncbi:hypothetical protein [Leifsonia sp. fls2-241-R2A-40a]|uniref:hypothetical protein n=1 Tax=Leifsonia sp. fls2-241-R2A-40a TaxID=3040290 RepID=UPI00254A5752|nr:hypothetical protein [Leifsonia sp. fls2-241-R2A-40a]